MNQRCNRCMRTRGSLVNGDLCDDCVFYIGSDHEPEDEILRPGLVKISAPIRKPGVKIDSQDSLEADVPINLLRGPKLESSKLLGYCFIPLPKE